MARSHLQVAVVDGNSPSGKLTPEVWIRVEARVPEMIMDHLLDSKRGHSLL